MQKQQGDCSTTSGANITCVKDLPPFLFHIRVTYVLQKQNARLEGFVTDGGYACVCPVSACCGYRGKVLSARQFEKHAGAESKNQNVNILLLNGKSLYDLFHELRGVPAEAFAEKFRAAAGVPMTVPAAEASSAPQGQQAGAPSWEPNGVQVDGVTAGPPSAPAPGRGDVVVLTEEKASLCPLGSKENSSTTELDTMCGVEGPAAEQIKDETGGDPVMHDVKVRVTETKYQLDNDLRDVRGLLSTGLLEGFRVTYRKDEVENVGRINGQGYSCGCPKCNYSSNIMNACEFEAHSVNLSGQNDHIFLDTGISLFRVVKALKPCKLNMLGDFIEEKIGFPPNFDEYNKWKASVQKRKDYLDAVAPDGCSTQSNTISNPNWSASKRRFGGQFRQGGTETSTPTFSGSPGKGVSGLSTGTSEKKATEETRSENTGDPLSITDVKSDSSVPTAGYFILLLKSIEANLRAWNVSLLAAPVDPEMAQIWSEKLGFTILSAEEKESVLEWHPLVMFKNLVLVQKSLA